MSALAGLLVLLHGAHEHVQTLRVEYCDSTAVPASSRPVAVLGGGAQQRLRWRDGAPWPQISTMRRRLWLVEPDLLRVELLHGDAVVRLGVRNGRHWWRWDREEGEMSGDLSELHALPSLPPLLDPPLLAPMRMLSELILTPSGVGMRAGRPVVCARGSTRRPGVLPEVSLELEFDAEHGTVLRRAIVQDQRVLQLTEAVDVEYGAPIEADLFDRRSFPDSPAQPR